MIRRFTKDVGRFRAGEVRDYSAETWKSIAKSSRGSLDDITEDATPRSEVQPKASEKKR